MLEGVGLRAVQNLHGGIGILHGKTGGNGQKWVGNGIWRGSFVNDDGTDQSLWFASAGEAVFSIWGYAGRRKSLITIEAMSDSELYAISRTELEEWFSSSVQAANFGRILFERQFLDLETWLISTAVPRAKERYLRLLEDNPELQFARDKLFGI